MLSTPEKTIILAGTICSSVFLFSTALDNINKISSHYSNISDSSHNKIIAINGATMILSGLAFSYFTFIAIK